MRLPYGNALEISSDSPPASGRRTNVRLSEMSPVDSLWALRAMR
jgi:hypothetical protein